MPSPFAISLPQSTVTLDEQGHGEAVFSVFNSSGRQIRGLGYPRLIPTDQGIPVSLAIDGEQAREFEVGQVRTYRVLIDVPQGAEAGSYIFRLVMVEESSPDENYTVGPTATFEVPPSPPPPGFPSWLWIVAAAAGAVIIGTVAVFALWPDDRVRVPPVGGEPWQDAVETITAAELTVDATSEEFHSTIEEEHVIRTDPNAETEVEKNSEVRLIVSSGRGIMIPDVAGHMEDTAKGILENACERAGSTSCFVITSTYSRYSSSRYEDPGRVMNTKPSIGERAKPGSEVTLFVSNGCSLWVSLCDPIEPPEATR